MSRFQMISDVQWSLIEEMLPRPTDAAEYKLPSHGVYAFAKGTFCLMPMSGKHPRMLYSTPNPHSYPDRYRAPAGRRRGSPASLRHRI